MSAATLVLLYLLAVIGAGVLVLATFIYVVRHWCPVCSRLSIRAAVLVPSGIGVWRCKRCDAEWVR